ncbi:hypothetical protein COT30_01860 [Candidatus Micrarchaeota archaeon CG08_land_8_20_14_0_20_49_17]|nr:MAG: hypothetical protein AUJ13_02260 [Candidatus Micrarchaeota archaeon CG1_02_49_24]PIU09957.1 MAG: hypothetical protein COT30_01860 [Candidatus Micrarchaeota archaeon CG08_land_8_20_14_0_20_49_17]PIZ99834.1 MAG: hypothetical protein COX84_00505 [Candidatus Micrarchaeota archaeon CG_4_10_14_0_2_um_filter_49_7]HII54070.1 TIM barrel protein [Candidatus Micrarchaeota archaeon]
MLLFGTAGIPISTERPDTVEGIKRVKALGLGCMELEFVRNVNVSAEKIPGVRKATEENGIALTAHGSYYINLNAHDEETRRASVKRLYSGAKTLAMCGGKSIVFHAAYYLKDSPAHVYGMVKKGIAEAQEMLKSDGLSGKVTIRPEISGKPVQFGNLGELIRVSQEMEGVLPCIDFAHMHARTNGKNNTPGEFRGIMEMIENGLGNEALKNMHIHMSGINYGEKGEKNHLTLGESDFRYKELLAVWKEFGIGGYVISESPNIEEDALRMKKYYDGL